MLRILTSATALCFLAATAIAMDSGGGSSGGGGGSSGGGGGGSSGTADTQCYNGKVYDKKKKMCVPKGADLDDESLIDHAYGLASNGKPHEALAFLDRVVDRGAARFLNIRGFATRKAGDVDAGIAFYKQALAIDADNALVREYLGEAYVTKGNFTLARSELDEIVRICGGTDCEEYRELADAIEGAGGAI